MIRALLGIFLCFGPCAQADAANESCQSQVQIATERALQDLPAGNMLQGLTAFTNMYNTHARVTVIASEKKGRNAEDADAEELSKRVVAFLETAAPFYLGVGDTGQDLRVPHAGMMGRLLKEPGFLDKFMQELESPDFDGYGNMALSIKVKASFVRNYLLSEKKIKEFDSIPIFIDTTPGTVMRQGFYVILNERGVTFPKIIKNLEQLALKWSKDVPVHFVIRANLMVIQPFHHSTEISMDFAQGHPFSMRSDYMPLVPSHFEQFKTYGASNSLYILAIPQPLKPL